MSVVAGRAREASLTEAPTRLASRTEQYSTLVGFFEKTKYVDLRFGKHAQLQPKFQFGERALSIEDEYGPHFRFIIRIYRVHFHFNRRIIIPTRR